MKTIELTEQIDKLVRDHLAQVRTAAAAAVARAFGTPSSRATKPSGQRRKRPDGDRRSSTFVTELGERLHAEVLAAPGESMAIYAKQLEASVARLGRTIQ